MKPQILVREALPNDEGELLDLIAAYQTFYEAKPNPERNARFFRRFWNGGTSEGIQFVACLSGETKLLGFATLYFTPSSISAAPYALLNDLFTEPSHRGQGVGRTLIEYCLDYVKARGFTGMEWMTARDNLSAQKLYDTLGAIRTNWYIYSLR